MRNKQQAEVKQKLFQLWRLKTIVLKGRSRKRWSEKREEKEKKSEETAETTAFTPWMCNVMSHRGQVRQRRLSLTSSFSFIPFCPIYSPGPLLSSHSKQITLKISHSQNTLLLRWHSAQNHLHATRKKKKFNGNNNESEMQQIISFPLKTKRKSTGGHQRGHKRCFPAE